MTRIDPSRKNRSVLSTQEFNLLRAEARGHPFEFLALRNEALLCALRLFGKRRAEFGSSVLRKKTAIPDTDPTEYTIVKTENPGMLRSAVWVDETYLNFSFKLLKKHKSKIPETVKSVSKQDPLAKPILDYIKYLDALNQPVKYFLPSAKNQFGHYVIKHEKGLPDRCVYDVVRTLGDACGVKVWPHLFRETVGADEVRKDPSVYGLSKVMRRLNIHERTAWAYIERHVTSVVKSEESQKE